jgi:hypothetical protein
MKKWEYQTFRITKKQQIERSLQIIIEDLGNEIGDMGWEYVSIHKEEDQSVILVFKREKKK